MGLSEAGSAEKQQEEHEERMALARIMNAFRAYRKYVRMRLGELSS